MDRIGELRKVLESLPTLTERLQTWNKIIKELDKEERNSFESCIKELEFKTNSVEDYKNYLELIESFYDFHKELFSTLLSRLELPILAYKERISELNNESFRIECKQFRLKEEVRCSEYALNLAEKYHKEYTGKTSHWDYMHICNSMVTGFLFQPGIIPCKNQEHRDIREEIFRGFNPQSYCQIFSNRLKKLFKQ